MRQSGILYVFAGLTVRHNEVLYVFGSLSGVFVFFVSLSVKQSVMLYVFMRLSVR